MNLPREERYFRKMREAGMSRLRARIAARRTADHVAKLRQRFPAIGNILLVATCKSDHTLYDFTLHYDASGLTWAEQDIAETMTMLWAESSRTASQ